MHDRGTLHLSFLFTLGTEFMARLQIQLKYFVNRKISTDPLWQKCTLYLSGHDVSTLS